MNSVLVDRKKTHGDFSENSKISQGFKKVYDPHKYKLDDMQREALEMIFHKISRVLSGNPNYIDHWRDISNYAKLVEDYLKEQDGALDSDVVYKW